MKRKLISVGVAATVLAIAGTGAALAGADDEDATLSGPQAGRAAAAALKAVGGGSASAVERDDDAAYEVEVRRANGSTVDVDVDGNYRVVAIDDDSENGSADDDRESGDADD
jgi:peptidase YpeB-like protein